MTATISDGRSERDKRFVVNLENDKPTDSKLQIGDKAILNRDVAFTQGFGICLIKAGTEVEITNYSNLCGGDLYEIKFQNAMSVVYGCDLAPIVSEQEIDFKFNVGDKVIYPLFRTNKSITVTKQFYIDGCPYYILTSDSGFEYVCSEENIHPDVPQDITERIKTFDDAYEWCLKNNPNLCAEYNGCKLHVIYTETLAYLKLRIITCALNEGWEPTFDGDEQRWYVYYHIEDGLPSVGSERLAFFDLQKPASLLFKSERLAKYAAAWFYDIYSDFCGYKEGGEG